MSLKNVLLSLVLIVLCPVTGNASEPFSTWLEGVKRDARAAGISEQTLASALSDIEPIERVIRLDRKQPESTITFPKYRDNVLPLSRISKGQELYREHRQLLDKIAAEYGVQPQYIVALWGMETSFGKVTGGFSVVNALATLAHDGRRSEFFRGELMNALTIIDAGHISAQDMQGSWAGAMGQCQFMPSSYLQFAVDYDGDGRKNIWSSLPDTFASIANYLAQSGWDDELIWGRRVQVPESFTSENTGRENRKPLSDWAQLGVIQHNGEQLPSSDLESAVVMLDGSRDTAYIVYNNYHVLMKWNRSVYFATAVGLLANEIAGG